MRAGEATLQSRNGNDLTERFAEVARALPGALRSADCVLDGEVCALDPDGHARFGLLQRGAGSLVVYLFDILELDGEDLTRRPLVDRRALLEQTLVPNDVVRLSVAFDDGPALLEQVRALGMEGIVSKRAQSLYQPGKRGGAWVKVKTRGRQEFVIAGYTLGKGRRSKGIGALILAVERDGELVHVGNCGTGFDDQELDRLQESARPPPARHVRARRCAAHAAGAHDRRDLGRAKARVRGRVRGVDVRRPASRAGLHGPSRRQARERGAPRAAGTEGPP